MKNDPFISFQPHNFYLMNMAVMGSSTAAAASGSNNDSRRKNRIPTSYAVIFLGIILLTALTAVSFTSPSTKSVISALSSLDIANHNQNDETTISSYSNNSFRNAAHRYLKTSHKHHKKLLPLDTSDKVGFFCATIGLMIAAGGGIGGGGVLVPIYILVMKFSPKHAIPLSNITG